MGLMSHKRKIRTLGIVGVVLALIVALKVSFKFLALGVLSTGLSIYVFWNYFYSFPVVFDIFIILLMAVFLVVFYFKGEKRGIYPCLVFGFIFVIHFSKMLFGSWQCGNMFFGLYIYEVGNLLIGLSLAVYTLYEYDWKSFYFWIPFCLGLIMFINHIYKLTQGVCI